MIRISENDDFVVDYDKERGMYRVSVFNDGHFWDEYWFDAYEEKELDNSFPQTIGDITYYSKAELFEWIENQQNNNKNCLSEVLKKYELPKCRWTEEQLKELVEYAKLSLTKDGVDLEELKKYVDKIGE